MTDAGVDAGPLDARPPDAGPLDAGPLDAGPVPTVTVVTPSAPVAWGIADDATAGGPFDTCFQVFVAEGAGGTLEVDTDLGPMTLLSSVAALDGLNDLCTTVPEGVQTVSFVLTAPGGTASDSVAVTVDITPPGPIVLGATLTDRRIGATHLTFSAPGDDGALGSATRYEIRRFDAPPMHADFDSGDLLFDVASGGPAGTAEALAVDSLRWQPAVGELTQVHHFAALAFDEVGNRSASLVASSVEVGLRRATLSSAATNLGQVVAAVGDVNGDSRTDVLVGSFFNVSVVYGAADLSTLHGTDGGGTALDLGAGILTSRSFPVGDVSNDGAADFVVLGFDFSGASRALLFFGGNGALSGSPDVVIDAPPGESFEAGGAAGNFSDVAAEGTTDFALTVPGTESGPAAGPGAAFVLLGRDAAEWPAAFSISSDLPTNLAQRVVPVQGASWEFGAALAGLDVPGDFSSLAVGDPGITTSVAYVFRGGPFASLQSGLDAWVDAIATSAPAGASRCGSGVAAGPLDAVPGDDLTVDCPSFSGRAVGVYFDPWNNPAPAQAVAAVGWTPPSGLVDLDSDGALDLVVSGAFLHVYRGDGTGAFATAPFLIFNVMNASVRVAGDMNGDGYPELIAASSDASVVHLLY